MSNSNPQERYEMQDGTTLCKEEIRDISHLVYGLYREGKYTCKLNIPVNPSMWSDSGWVNWINTTGRWWHDDCWWEYVERGKYKSCRSSGFLKRWNMAVDHEIKDGFDEAKKSSPELTADNLKELIEHNKNLVNNQDA